MAKKPKEYRINTFKDLCNVITMENKERLLTDLTLAFTGYAQAIDQVRKAYPSELKDMKNWEIAQYGFVWIDDGGHDIKGAIIETDTGTFTIKK